MRAGDSKSLRRASDAQSLDLFLERGKLSLRESVRMKILYHLVLLRAIRKALVVLWSATLPSQPVWKCGRICAKGPLLGLNILGSSEKVPSQPAQID